MLSTFPIQLGFIYLNILPLVLLPVLNFSFSTSAILINLNKVTSSSQVCIHVVSGPDPGNLTLKLNPLSTNGTFIERYFITLN